MMLEELGHPVYVEDFEKPFLAAAADFYKVGVAGVADERREEGEIVRCL